MYMLSKAALTDHSPDIDRVVLGHNTLTVVLGILAKFTPLGICDLLFIK